MNDNKELNDNLERLFSTIKDAYGIASMIKDIKEKEVGNKDYEVMSYMGNGCIYYKTSTDKFVYEKDSTYQIEQPEKYGWLEINSVKRLNDTELFTKGDTTDEGVIRGFYITGVDKKLWIRTEEKGGVVSINDIEKIVPKDYEILELITHGGEKRFLQNGLYHYYSDGVGFELDYLLSRKDTTIHSVKRLSDNEVFTSREKTEEGTIKSFYYNDYGQMIVAFEEMIGDMNINALTKVKERVPLFTTEDNVPIFEGDRFWFVAIKEDTVYCADNKWDLGSNIATEVHTLPITKNYKYFSTEDKAKEYIYHNKPCLSYNDAVHWLATNGSGYGLYEIVKEKINNNTTD